ncbi:MAG: TetR-like C-terminal domain-containing protein, partial [Nevskiales bacterium]
PELVEAGARSRATMTAHLLAMIDDGVVKGDPDLIGHMFWSALHGAIQLQLAGMLSPPFDAKRLAGEIMRTLWLGLNADPV